MSVSDFLFDKAVEDIWANPHQDRHAIFKMVRLSKTGGAIGNVDLSFNCITLPSSDRRFALYEIGGVTPASIGIENAVLDWTLIPSLIDSSNMIAMLFSKGRLAKLDKCYIKRLQTGNLVIAIDYFANTHMLQLQDDVYVRFYSNKHLDDTGASVAYDSLEIEASSGPWLTYSNTYAAAVLASGGLGWVYLNGLLLPDGMPNHAGLNVGDHLQYIVDPHAQWSQSFVFDDMPSYVSVEDSVRKVIASSEVDSFNVYVDDIEFYLTGIRQSDGRRVGTYFPRLMGSDIRNLTFKDWALNAVRLDAVEDELQAFNDSGTEVTDFEVLMYQRENANYYPVMHDANRIPDLMNLPKERRLQVMTGVDSNLPVWQSNNLETCPYNRWLGLTANDVTLANMFGVYSRYAAIGCVERVYQEPSEVEWRLPPMAANGGGRKLDFDIDGLRDYTVVPGWVTDYNLGVLSDDHQDLFVEPDGVTVTAPTPNVPGQGSGGVVAGYYPDMVLDATEQGVYYHLPDPVGLVSGAAYVGFATDVATLTPTFSALFIITPTGPGPSYELIACGDAFAGTAPLENIAIPIALPWTSNTRFCISYATGGTFGNGVIRFYTSAQPNVVIYTYNIPVAHATPDSWMQYVFFETNVPHSSGIDLAPAIEHSNVTKLGGGSTATLNDVIYDASNHAGETFVDGNGAELFLPDQEAALDLDIVVPAGSSADTTIVDGFGIFCYYNNLGTLHPASIGSDYTLVEDGAGNTDIVWENHLHPFERYVRSANRRVEWFRDDVGVAEVKAGIDIYQGRVKSHDVGMESCYLWVNKRYMIEGLDYNIHGGKIYLTTNSAAIGTSPYIVECVYAGLPDVTLKHKPKGDWGWVKYGKVSYDNTYNLYSNRNRWLFTDGKVVPPSKIFGAENYEEINLGGGDIPPVDGTPFAFVPMVQFSRNEDISLAAPNASAEESLDVQIENYLSTIYPQGEDLGPIVIASAYDLFSPFMTALIDAIVGGSLTVPADFHLASAMNATTAPYVALLNVDPANRGIDPEFAEIRPHFADGPHGVSIEEFHFLQHANDFYLNGEVKGFSTYLQIV